MNIMHASDIHYAPETLDEVDRCFTFAVDKAIERECQIAALPGDLFDHRVDLNSPAVAAILKQVHRLASRMPVIILQGTRSHDVPGSLDVFKTIGGRCQVFVADRICQVALTDQYIWVQSDGWAFTDDLPARTLALFSCLPSVDKGAVAAAVGAENAATAVGEQVFALLKGWSVPNLKARAAGIPTVLLSHGTISGSVTEHGVPMAGLDHEFTTGALFAAEASAAMIGHIHQHQEWEQHGRRIAYAGSTGRLHFGELTDKGVLFWNVEADRATAEFVTTPAKKLLQVDFDGPPNMEQLREIAAQAEHAHVRIRWSVDEEHRHVIDKDAIRQMFGAAAAIKLEGRINPIQRTRSGGINRAKNLHEKLAAWCEVTATTAGPLQDRLAMLETHSVEHIVQTVVTEPEKEKAA